MIGWNRRAFLAGATAGGLSACAGGTNSDRRLIIDDRVSAALEQMQSEVPFTSWMVENAAGILMMPLVTKFGLFLGGAAYGEGSLLIDYAPVDYYSVTSGSFGPQLGAHQYSSALFFMDAEHLRKFRERNGWTTGVDLEFTTMNSAISSGLDNDTIYEAIHAVVFNQEGMLAGFSLEGSKYSRIVR